VIGFLDFQWRGDGVQNFNAAIFSSMSKDFHDYRLYKVIFEECELNASDIVKFGWSNVL